MAEYDILIKDALIVDGVSKSRKGSVGVKDGRVIDVGIAEGDAETVIEAEGLIVSPGFVDPHSHADNGFAWYPGCESAVMQGCTTVVAGQCGGSPAPIREYMRPPGQLFDEVYESRPYLYHGPSLLRVEEVNELMQAKYGWTIDYRTMAEYFELLRGKGIGINYVPLLGHGTVRHAVMGEDYKREATSREVENMIELIHQGMVEGCQGMSAGLDYDPDVFASRKEIDDCVSVLKDYGGIYVPHWRRTGRRRQVKMGGYSSEPIEGIREVIETARATGVRLNVAHLAPGWYTQPPMTPAIGEAVGKATLEPIDEAVREGLDIGFDVIPWECWEPFPYLCSLHFTQWLRLLGSCEKLAEWLKVEEFRNKAWEEIESGKLFQRLVVNPCVNAHWAENLRIVTHSNPQAAGCSLKEASEKLGKDPWNTLCDLVVEDPDSRASHTDYRGPEEQMKEFFRHPLGAVGLDVGVSDDADTENKAPPYGTPLPDQFSGYTKFLTRYVRDSDFLTIEEAVYKCAALPAKTYRLKDRGVLAPGAHADIVLIDLDGMGIVGHPELSVTYPTGMPYVMVNGELVVKDGKITGARPGEIVLRG
ncbi:amidohydrolase family protein [Candidatus Bathyarchaeota archaeon]|nr:amidohydrolase family protein [Candidatus Bathyarchaeota archaeon]